MKVMAAGCVLVALLVGCATAGPAVSKSRMGNLELTVRCPGDADVGQAQVYVDGAYIGNASRLKPILYLRRGERTVRVSLNGFRTYEGIVTVLGDPNQQVLNVYLEPE